MLGKVVVNQSSEIQKTLDLKLGGDSKNCTRSIKWPIIILLLTVKPQLITFPHLSSDNTNVLVLTLGFKNMVLL